MRSVFYGVLLTVFVAGAGYVQAANDQDYISISDEPAFTPKPSTGDDDYISISDESVITPKPSTGIADGNASAGECGKGKQLCRDGFCRVSCESSEEMDSEVRATDRFVGPAVRRVVGDGAEDSGVSTDADMNDANVICLKKYDRKRGKVITECQQ